MKNIVSLFLIIASIGIFFGVSKPQFKAAATSKQELTIYENTLDEVKKLEEQISALQGKIGELDKEELSRLEKLLPDTISNVNLIIDINTIAVDAGLPGIREINIEENNDLSEEASKSVPKKNDSLYNSIDLSFSVTSSYPNFIKFITSLEKSLRIVDVTSVSFTPEDTNTYDFKVTIRTYWLK